MSGDDPDTERAAFEALWDDNYAAVLAYARRRFDEEDARDVAAETFLVAWRRRQDLPEQATTPWLYGIARKVAADRHRAIDRAGRLTLRLAHERAPDQRPEDQGSGKRLLEALTRLSEQDREILLLTAWEELTPAQAAIALGCTPTAARVRLHRARARLRRLLALHDDDPGLVTGESLEGSGS